MVQWLSAFKLNLIINTKGELQQPNTSQNLHVEHHEMQQLKRIVTEALHATVFFQTKFQS